MDDFNLVDEPWIPCIDLQGIRVEHGIRDTLLNAHELQEICDDSPLVTVAIHRLLLAALYRAYSGPVNFSTWKAIFNAKSFDLTTVNAYFDRWKKRFNLFCPEEPFYQMGTLETKAQISINRLSMESASGNNDTLFDHCVDDGLVEWEPATAARQLVACQSFALGFGKSGNARINGAEETLPYSADAIALRGMNIWLQGENLFKTLAINLIPREDGSQPPWELDDPHLYRDKLHDNKRRAISSLGVVDRLTWQSRLVRLIPSERGKVSRMYFTQGRCADKGIGDPMKVYRASEEEGISPLPLRSEKAAWRDAHAILTIPPAGSSERRPECFNLLARARSSAVIAASERFVVQIVGLASAPGKAGKFLLWRHERMPLPAALLGELDLIEHLGGLIQNAEQAAIVLDNRIRRIARLYLSPTSASPDGRQPDKDDVANLVNAIDPRPVYWARLEEHFFTLLETLPNDWDEANTDWKQDDQQQATQTWREQIKKEGRRALEESVRSLGTTARVIQAVARVRTDFNDDDLKPLAQKTGKMKTKGGRKK